MMSRKSTPPPTAADLERFAKCKALGCVVCRTIGRVNRCGPAEYHHLTRGGVRLGHAYGVALGSFHHRGHILPGWNLDEMTGAYGWSLFHHKRKFAARYPDQQLLDYQNDLLGVPRVTIPTKRAPSARASKVTGNRNGANTASPSKMLPRRY